MKRAYDGAYSGEQLSRVAFPLGGIGAGMVCLEGCGALSHVSLRNKPDVFNEPLAFAALCVKGKKNTARVLEGPVPAWKIFGAPATGNGAHGKSYGLPRFDCAEFTARFPFADIKLSDPGIPLETTVTGWSPFVPGDADNSSLPVAALEYRFVNRSRKVVEAVYSFHAKNFMEKPNPNVLASPEAGGPEVLARRDGFVLVQPGTKAAPWDEGAFSATVDDARVKVNAKWFRGGWFDALTLVWKSVAEGLTPSAKDVGTKAPSPGGSLYVPFKLKPGQEKIIRLRLAWYVPRSDIRQGKDPEEATCGSGCDCKKDDKPKPSYRPWYAARFQDIGQVMDYWRTNFADLRRKSANFSECFYDTTLPAEVVDAVAANLTILKSPTCLRQADGRFWGWEGCGDNNGCCSGSCTHVWNYAQAIPHLFPSLERSMRETEFGACQDEKGHQMFRAGLPIRPVKHDFHAAADGQLGGIMKVYRDWRISGDTAWLRRLWPRIKASLDYGIQTWDPDRQGLLSEPHHNTYDIEFWGPDGMCTSFYLGALKAAAQMAVALGDDATEYDELYDRGMKNMEKSLYNGEYFIQKVQWKNLKARNPAAEAREKKQSAELVALLEKEGPRYQYGTGCLSDGVLGAWMAEVCGVGKILTPKKVESHLVAIHRHNFRKDLSTFANPQRPGYALGHEAGLLLASWPRGGEPSLPFVYSNEVWTGIEYQVASHLMLTGHVKPALEIVRAVRDRYDGRIRNPFNEYECGHWYARAMSSYGLLQGMTGVRYDAVEQVLHIQPAIRGDFRAFLSTATGYGTVGIRKGKPFVEVKSGKIAIKRITCD
jgi:uncharacterized protein (DUF608 family)